MTNRCQQLYANLTIEQGNVLNTYALLTTAQDSLLSNQQQQIAMRLKPGFIPSDPAYVALHQAAQQLQAQIQAYQAAVTEYQGIIATIRAEIANNCQPGSGS